MNIICDARSLRMYAVGRNGFHGGTELYLQRVAHGLAQRGHIVHVVTPDLPKEEQRGPSEWWWAPTWFPRETDILVCFHNTEFMGDYSAPLVVLASNGIDPYLGPDNAHIANVDAYAVFSEVHRDLLHRTRGVPEDRCYLTGLGVDLDDYALDLPAVPGRMLFCNDPARGLWHVLDIFDRVRDAVPGATLHVAYDFERQFQQHRWAATALAEALWECKRRLDGTPGVVNLGALTRGSLAREQMECQVHAMPSDPPNVGSQIHGISQMELAAARTPLVLSDTEAFPEVFGSAATILPLPGSYLPAEERRLDAQDWADHVVEIMTDPERWREMSERSVALAEKHTWAAVVDKWEEMLRSLAKMS